ASYSSSSTTDTMARTERAGCEMVRPTICWTRFMPPTMTLNRFGSRLSQASAGSEALSEATAILFRRSEPSALRGIDLRQPLPPDGTCQSVARVRSSEGGDHHVSAKVRLDRGPVKADSPPCGAKRSGAP